MLVLELLKWAAAASPSSGAERIASLLGEGHEREVRWVLDAGLGPMLYRATREHFDYVPSALRDVLLSSDLTAQVRHACVIDTANEVIDVSHNLSTPVTLLKGISISEQYYPAPHLRPMGDIDLLVPKEASEALELALLCRDYQRQHNYDPTDDMHFGAHHGAPLFQRKSQVWVEIHTALFASRDKLTRGELFGSTHISENLVSSLFHGRQIHRLNDELQLIYIASSWMRDLTLVGIYPSFLVSLLDLIYLLKAAGPSMDWGTLLRWLDNDMAIASLYVTLGYLSRHGLYDVSRETQTYLRCRQDLVGRFQMRTIHAMLDHYLIGCRYWNLSLPPPVPGRYSVRNQLRKLPTRLMTLLRSP